ncbi:nucleoside deaminase [Roseateles sp.]|uniref:nucleoside deaminase n=1 Tax=Roseateles sp. TaxID=1971397 RepID=UPI003D0F6245
MRLKSALISVFVLLACVNVQACELVFRVVGDPDSYPYEKLPEFVRKEMRPRVAQGADSDRYGLQIQYVCDPQSGEQSLSAIFKIQPNTVYLKDVNELPLCVEDPAAKRCVPGKYNYVDYKGGSPLFIGRSETINALRALSGISSQSDLETNDPTRQIAIHNAVRLFAMQLAEATRFDYVLDDLTCAVASGDSVKFMDYWGLVHNWGTISRVISQGGPDALKLKSSETYKGGGALFVPITRQMVPYFNAFLPTVQGKPDWKPTNDGKNKVIDLRSPACALVPADSKPVHPNAGAAVERDEIFGLLSMAVVLQDWQSSTNGRGHNIGSVLVTPDHRPVYYARNSIRALDNTTQHGEVRLVQNYLNCKGVKKTAEDLTVYTTLEPCAMCSGMMTMAEVSRVIYVQKDPSYGGVREALKSISYPRVYSQDTTAALIQKQSIEVGYDKYRSAGKGSLTNYLLTDEAKGIFESARSALLNYAVMFPENGKILDRARDFLGSVKAETFGDAMLDRCPAP